MANEDKAKKPLAVYTISSRDPFVDTLAQGVLDLCEQDPARLAAYQILLPTRRACRSLRDAFLRLSGGKPMLLPRMTPIGDVDEDELALTFGDTTQDVTGVNPLDIPPAISPLRRQLYLARMIMARGDTSADQAIRLAVELARLLDQLHTEQLDFSKFETLVPDTYSEHWQETLKFLEILTRQWPDILESDGTIDAADRRNRLLASQTELWRRQPPATPVIAAGSTGSIPATAELLKTIAGLETGSVVLPGLDKDMTDRAWQALEPHHPQYGLSRLLASFGIKRQAVQDWRVTRDQDRNPNPDRTPLARAALAPARETAQMSEPLPAETIHDLRLATCPTSREEAGVIALAIRETLETPEKTVALVTPDRGLARRVATELLRWGIDVDDSAGVPLGQTAPGSFLRATARMVGERYAPVALLSALKHPLASGGMDRAVFRSLVRQLEVSILRGPRPAAGLAGLRLALAESQTDTAHLDHLLDQVQQATTGMDTLFAQNSFNLADMIRAHVSLIERLASSDKTPGAESVWAGDAGEALAGFMADLMDHADVMSDISPATYPAFLDGLMAGRAVRPRYGLHPRVFIWGLMEARLQRADLVILGGLNEGTWPPQTDTGPWMSRPMMDGLGLSQPERQIGLTAHDFVQAFSAPHVLLTRAERVDGTPMVPSRWLMRLSNTLLGAKLENGLPKDTTYLTWFEALDRPDAVRPASPPAPKPPVKARPRKLSVTAIETWMRDPYSIYARYVLGLKPLDPLDADPGAADRGTLIHQILETFMNRYRVELPDDAEDRLIEMGADEFQKHLSRPGVQAFWWPRFLRIASWFIAFERHRRERGIETVLVEKSGSLSFKVGDISFELTAKADRMDRLPDGSLAILDYKTGQPPSAKQVETWLVPQLSLEAAMAMEGVFPDLEAAPVRDLVYVRLSGGRVAGEVRTLKLDAEDVARKSIARLKSYVNSFNNPDMPYRSRPRPMFKSRFGDYDHLARVREWSSADGEDGA